MKKRALVSVSDKTGVVDFCKRLSACGYEIVSTGGTAKALTDAGLPVVGISDVTGFPECLDGRVKTLHPAVHAGLLAMRSNPEHMSQLEKLGINTIDIVVVNLYPFKATISKPGVTFADAVENIDIGGPTMIRAAAKNYQDVAVVVDPRDYERVLSELEAGGITLETKKYLQYKVFAHTAVYDSLISNYLAQQLGIRFPESVTFAYEKAQDMRYGENPHQGASYYNEEFIRVGSLSKAKQLWGKELSYNNINDANGALELVKEFDEPCVVASKHANPCGVGVGENIYEAYIKAYESDPVSVFGGILAINGIVDERTAAEINKIFIEIVIAEGYTPEALAVLKTKKNIRILELPDIRARREESAYDMKKVYGGLLIQDYDETLYDEADVKVVTKRAPTNAERKALLFNWKVVKYTKSNAIVIGKEDRTTGIGMGQTNRIWAAQQAIEHAGEEAKGSVMASDAFFPFPDCVEECVKAGITAIIQPGGSIRDQLSIDACDEAGIAMIFVGQRHFRH
ncbi:MAG: bifunctional phosphoribosylaminoimidazolecarboxamide formyltransferase/IMP cyclohydrolase [Firmicutes bacterium]|nr:bifunctional phosphoribosylaminoimidazolecarboxamide formyltransferase/IMP cyclohydrolase [Clostridia bacterium]MBS5023554.1 bifunctional phosphoribosylaminoimidazolecarboxamide formyltransferase/IMP cyclohydrolase [Bacillota bacterium]